MATVIERLAAELAELEAAFAALAAADEVAIIDTGERWQLLEAAALVRLRRRIADVIRRLDAAERAVGCSDE